MRFQLFAVRLSCCFLAMLLLATVPASAQISPTFRTTELASDHPGAAHISPTLLDPWGIAFLPGGNFFIAENASGRVDSYDASGAIGVGVAIPAPPGSNAPFSKPTGITAVTEPNVGPLGTSFQFLVAADNGTIWGFSTANGAPGVATRFVDNSGGLASYTGIAFLHPDCCGPYIAVANFGQGTIDTFTRFGDPLSLAPNTPNPFVDPDLPEGFAPFNIQLIGNQVFVTYAARDSNRQPILNSNTVGLGLVNVFDTSGNFVKRFVPPFGHLDAPWGVTQASANFGPFPNDILIGNLDRDGDINAFDPNTGEFLGPLFGEDGTPLSFVALRGLAFRSDGVGGADNLYYADGAAEGEPPSGVFGAITTGSSDRLLLSIPQNPLPGAPVTLTATVTSGSGVPTGVVTFLDTCCTDSTGLTTQTILGKAMLVNGVGTITATLTPGTHVVSAGYSGDDNFVPSHDSLTVNIPFANLAPEITSFTPFSAKQNSGAFTLTVNGSNFVNGATVFFNGSARATKFVSSTRVTAAISAADIAASGTAIVIVNNPAPGGGSSAGAMFAIDTATSTSVLLSNDALKVAAGQSVGVSVQVTGFTGTISATCLNAPAGVTCAFNSSNSSVTIQTSDKTPKGSHIITLVVSAQLLARNNSMPGFLAMTLGFFTLPLGSIVMEVRRRRKLKPAVWIVLVAALLLLMTACGGYGGSKGMQTNPPSQTQPGQASASLTLTVQ